MTVLEIVEKYLRDNGYDGLYNPDDECGCLINDLAPCGEMNEECRAGIILERDSGGYDFIIGERR